MSIHPRPVSSCRPRVRRAATIAAVLTVVVLSAGCARATARGGASGGSPDARYVGLWQASVAVGQRASYTGTLTVGGTAPALTGILRLTSPITVDANLTGSAAGGVMTLSGSYTAGNGCTGTIRISASGAQGPLQGPTEMDDRCAGRLTATTTLQR